MAGVPDYIVAEFKAYRAVIRFYMGRPNSRRGRYIYPDEIVLWDGYTVQMAETDENWTNINVDGAIARGWLVYDPTYITGIEVSDEGTILSAQIDKMNFVGSGITVTLDPLDPTKVNVSVPGGGTANLHTAKTSIFQSTTSDQYQTALTLTTAILPAGQYRVGWGYIWSYDSISQGKDFKARVQLDGATTIGIHQQQPKDASGTGDGGTDQRFQTTGFTYFTSIGAVHTITLEYCSSRKGVTASIYEAVIELWQV
jgi:hypothetical protein